MKKFDEMIKRFENGIDKEIEGVVKWIQDYVKNSGLNGCVLGMSGGVDCSCVAMLLKKAGIDTILVRMPYGKSMEYARDNDDSMELIKGNDFRYMDIDITQSVDFLEHGIKANIVNTAGIDNGMGYVECNDEIIEGHRGFIQVSDMAKANIKPRVRMTTLYGIAQSLGYLVVGTGNLSEATMGYSTKWGDAAADFNPLANLTKTEVRIMAKRLGVPSCIVEKAPSANLWDGQTDEEEMGITYYELDEYILTGESSSEDVKNKIEKTKKAVAHKNNPIPVWER